MKNEIIWLGPYKPTDRFADDVTVADIIQLRKENQELKDYLEKLEQYMKFLEAGVVDKDLAESIGRGIDVRVSGSP